jgi:hypothetical protein
MAATKEEIAARIAAVKARTPPGNGQVPQMRIAAAAPARTATPTVAPVAATATTDEAPPEPVPSTLIRRVLRERPRPVEDPKVHYVRTLLKAVAPPPPSTTDPALRVSSAPNNDTDIPPAPSVAERIRQKRGL